MIKIIAVTLILLTVGVFYLINTYRPKSSDIRITPMVSTPTTIMNPTGYGNPELGAGGSTYLDPKGVFNLLYPDDFKIDQQGDGQYTRLTKIGGTQKGQTEMYDGILMVFEVIDLQNQTLEEWVDMTIKTSTQDGTMAVIEPKSPVTLNGYNGFTYTLRGLGASKYMVVQKNVDSKYAVSIVSAVDDPENLGYQAEVDSIFSHMSLLK